METADTLEFLLGTWRVTRWIEDHQAGMHGSFTGTATMTESPAAAGGARRARYEEAGELRFGAHVGPARRSLDYTWRDDRTVTIAFADGRPFVALDLRAGSWRSDHLCGADRYEITSVVRSDCVVEEYWRVQGPAKRYDAVTTLIRVSDDKTRPADHRPHRR